MADDKIKMETNDSVAMDHDTTADVGNPEAAADQTVVESSAEYCILRSGPKIDKSSGSGRPQKPAAKAEPLKRSGHIVQKKKKRDPKKQSYTRPQRRLLKEILYEISNQGLLFNESQHKSQNAPRFRQRHLPEHLIDLTEDLV